ncbi:adenylate/guanylate cyclase domain-containing protein [Paracoccus sp. P2]|uniref:Tetratricopeptide repeat protein n=1 Tax=Paracoccus pantotrophus TaxID=82367 RepID=A0A1I5GWH6_PARPN|nr:adenylate/guanylate cyclase domain-containing protein [Paracoccus pantotrophus]MDF3854550.1 adenylate/guanylate cyclase domain-containing protein [Paracoccus pantotrophus]QFG38436.1 tetratricopeptide repeat protein [Paracoccus pantotrophus]QLH15989.1 tetratricopeptide repeat protein [Paracoccus pantotrophus]RDD93301.1 tetratricopeptide repeat protein [Paracoccus pantotrophus]RKS51041.1 TolB-like protein [Paracoccus pantotrophus]
MTEQPGLTGPRLQAVLYADIHGYTRLIEQDEAGTILRLTRSLALIRNLVGDYGGTVVNTAGDGLVAVFQDVHKALHFAIEMQRELSCESAWAETREPIAWRVGISLGETFEGQDGVYGHSVNLAARIQSFAEPGGICVTETVYRIVRDNAQLALRSLGRRRLKNISAPVEIYAAMPSAAAAAPASPLPRDMLRRTDPSQPDASLAILPMENLSADPRDQHLCQGIVADLITNLSRFRQLMVIARHSSVLVAAQTTSLREIGRRLGVRYLLTGGFRRAGNRLRITVDLAEAESENVIWSERYDGVMQDIFDFQDDVTAMTAARVAIQLDTAERRRLAEQAHPALYAYGLVLRGQDMGLRFLPDANLHARRLFEEARDLDPSYGRSYAAMSRTFNVEWRYNWTNDPDAALNQALVLAKRAVQCDNLDSRGFSEMGLAHLYKKQHDEALAAYEHALELNPNDADLLAYTGDCLAYVRQGDRAVQLLERAMRLNPYYPDAYLWFLGDAHFHHGDYARTIETLSKMRDQSEAHRLLAASHALLGQMDEARHHARAVMQVHPNFTIAHWRKVPPLKHPEDLELYVEGLRKAGLT